MDNYRLQATMPDGRTGYTAVYPLDTLIAVGQEYRNAGAIFTGIVRCDQDGYMVIDQSNLPDYVTLLDSVDAPLPTADDIVAGFRNTVNI